jgi:hypothetical protein
MMKPGWVPILGYQHSLGAALSYAESGGGGDCMFHAINAALGGVSSVQSLREIAGSAVTVENAPDALMDMSAQSPANLAAQMDARTDDRGLGQFSPSQAWNEAKGNPALMAAALSGAVKKCGNTLWGDATIACLLEDPLGVNIILLADSMDVKSPLTGTETKLARQVYAQWVMLYLQDYPEMAKLEDLDIVGGLARLGLTMERAKTSARQMSGKHQWIRGRRMPVGSSRALCAITAAADDAVNQVRRGYRADRPTILLWNRKNVHWVPVAVGPTCETMIAPDSPMRARVDALLDD